MSTEPSNISIVTPILNRAPFIPPLLSAMANQTLLPDRVIIIDDGSDDAPDAAIREWQNANPKSFDIEYVRHPRTLGVSQARNSGIQALEGKNCEFVYFLDSDDMPPPKFLEATRAALAADASAVAATTDRIIISDTDETYLDQSEIMQNPWRWFLIRGAGVASCTLLRMATVREVGGFNTTLETAEDTEFFCQIANHGKWAYAIGAPVKYLQKSNLVHLRNLHNDYLRRWALVFENCIENFGMRENIELRLIRREMAKRWRHAGEQLFTQGRYDESEECIRRALAWSIVARRNLAWMAVHILLRRLVKNWVLTVRKSGY